MNFMAHLHQRLKPYKIGGMTLKEIGRPQKMNRSGLPLNVTTPENRRYGVSKNFTNLLRSQTDPLVQGCQFCNNKKSVS